MMFLAGARYVLVCLWALIFSLAGLAVAIFFPFNPRLIRPLGKVLGSVSLWLCGIELEVRGRDILWGNRPCVFISNHQHNLDLLLIAGMIPPLTVSIGKRSIKWFPLFGTLYWLAGNILINRRNKHSSLNGLARAERAMKQEGISPWIMPEGTRSKGRGLLPFKKGAFCVAVNTQRPIVPVAFSSYWHTLDIGKWRAGKVILAALPPIPTTGLKVPEDLKSLMDHCRTELTTSIESLDKELSRP